MAGIEPRTSTGEIGVLDFTAMDANSARAYLEERLAKCGWDPQVVQVHTDAPCRLCEHQAEETARRLGVVTTGLTAEDVEKILEDARLKGVRTFALDTTLRGVPLKLSATFEPRRSNRSADADEG